MSEKSSQVGIEGRLYIRVKRSDEGGAAVNIHSTRPLSTPRIFTGKTPRQVVSTLPLLYSVCGAAQGCAAVEALEWAMGDMALPEVVHARRAIVLAEIARFLKGRPGLNILVVGHTDNLGAFEYNISLSSRRANSVARYLA